MKKLDLHTVKHTNAPDEIRKFLNYAEIPAKIVTGHSKKMREIVEKIVKEYDYYCYFESSSNFGALIINNIN